MINNEAWRTCGYGWPTKYHFRCSPSERHKAKQDGQTRRLAISSDDRSWRQRDSSHGNPDRHGKVASATQGYRGVRWHGRSCARSRAIAYTWKPRRISQWVGRQALWCPSSVCLFSELLSTGYMIVLPLDRWTVWQWTFVSLLFPVSNARFVVDFLLSLPDIIRRAPLTESKSLRSCSNWGSAEFGNASNRADLIEETRTKVTAILSAQPEQNELKETTMKG